MKILIFLNPIKIGIHGYAEKVKKKLTSLGTEVVVYKDCQKLFCKEKNFFNDDVEKYVQKSDIILTIGGDGTIIHLAKYAAKFSKPILGINFGRLGFVTGLEKNEIDKLELLVKGKYNIQHRSLLKIFVYEDNKLSNFFAVNDVVISKCLETKILDFSINSNNNKVCSYSADGVIVATSTGSTAYSFSAGGPIVSPELNCLLLTPICPHSIFAKPIIFSEKDNIEILTKARNNGSISLTIDGENVVKFNSFSKVVVKCAKERVGIINFDSRCFYKRLSEKLLNKCE